MSPIASSIPWLALAAFASGAGALFLLRYLLGYRDRPGVDWFLLTIGSMALFCLSYGAGLLVFDPGVREALEVLAWIGLAWTGVPFLAFALAYTGRSAIVRTLPFRALFAAPVALTLAALATPATGLLWTDFRVVPILGQAGAQYALQPWAIAVFVGGVLAAGVATLLLFDTVLSYGPLYRREAAAVALSAVPPGLGGVVWLFELGPAPQFNAMAVMFLPHVALDAYAFVGNNMFHSHPATRRAAEQTVLDDIENPIVVLDENGLVVRLNDAAEQLLDTTDTAALGTSVSEVVDPSLTVDGSDQHVTIRSEGRHCEYAISTSILRDSSGNQVGYTLVFQDITVERQREQRLQVLNRTLRHNLRNDLNVVHGYLEMASERIDDDGVASTLHVAEEMTIELMELGTRARQFEQAVSDERDGSQDPVSLDDVLDDVTTDARLDERPAGIEIDVPSSLVLDADERLLRVVLVNLFESCLEYADDPPEFEIQSRGRLSSEFSRLEVRMIGASVPDYEIDVVEDGEETALDHGSGLGLWFVKWGVSTLGGDIEFETRDAETAVRLQLPVAETPATGDAATEESTAD
ncbi:PAS fold [Natronoarchaeum philippinense]|uniref:histidine kinase n=1 Tax=Natronoarchaeum philippinense TaxID=558529 RepID=A0A285P8W9_NATPI|nr:histidine kinase N-terminal 7TM domain-containing protein [Natronoarchaeum philippinense]SNZ17697.1 PAS fold [Natronoarchaeum philippinense]